MLTHRITFLDCLFLKSVGFMSLNHSYFYYIDKGDGLNSGQLQKLVQSLQNIIETQRVHSSMLQAILRHVNTQS